MAGEICGFFTWLWVFYRAKHDLPVVLGMRHPWEHGEDPFAIHDHVDNLEGLEKEWEEFAEKSGRPGEDDDDDVSLICFSSSRRGVLLILSAFSLVLACCIVYLI